MDHCGTVQHVLIGNATLLYMSSLKLTITYCLTTVRGNCCSCHHSKWPACYVSCQFYCIVMVHSLSYRDSPVIFGFLFFCGVQCQRWLIFLSFAITCRVWPDKHTRRTSPPWVWGLCGQVSTWRAVHLYPPAFTMFGRTVRDAYALHLRRGKISSPQKTVCSTYLRIHWWVYIA